ncbi:MAG TPA: peptidylprolyl isomerase [Stellaceae bacterium]|jgi:peptidyl-prolyl cis-trans isomerase SurA|nr:peptidylprolyl isomerase [Stellaceae bacterium]
MKPLRVALALILVLLTPGVAAQAQETRIAAVVNDEVISVADLAARIRLVFASSNIPDTPDTRQRVTRQVVRMLIDEKLEMQEAKRLNITVSDDEVAKALVNIEAQNKLSKGGLDSMLTARGVPRGTLVDQVTATLAWSKVVRQNLNRVTPISDEEVDSAIARLRETEDQPRARIAEIFLAVNNPQQDEEVHRFADQLFDQLRQGAHFPALAQQFSQSATAAVGGDIGWVSPSQLASEIGSTVQKLNPGELAPPVRAAGGYYLILVTDKQTGGNSEEDTRVALVQIMFPLPANATPADRQKVTAQAESVSKEAKSCGEMARIGREQAPQTSGEIGKLRVGDLPAELRKTVLGLQVAEASPPVPLRGGIGVLMVCERESAANALPSRDQMADDLARERFENLQQRYLRDLRRAAFVDMRV